MTPTTRHILYFAACGLMPVILTGSGCSRVKASPSEPATAGESTPTVFTFGETGTGPGQFVEPRAIAASPDGKLFVIDKSGRVQRFDSNGQFEHQWYLPEYDEGYPSGIEVAPDGRVFVADTHYSRILIFDRDGNELQRFGSPGRSSGQFLLPTDIAFASTGTIFVAEYGGNDRVSKFNSNNTFEMHLGHTDSGLGAVLNPTAVECSSDDSVWVVDSCRHRLSHFDNHGKYLGSISDLQGSNASLKYPGGLEITKANAIVVSDTANDRIVILDEVDGKVLAVHGSPGRGIADLYKPLGLAAISDWLFIADSGNNRIKRVSLSSLIDSVKH